MPEDLHALLLKRLKEWRRHSGLTQEKFAEAANMGLKYFQLVEQGHRVDLRLSTLQKLASAFGVEVWELLDPNMPPPAKPLPKKPRGASKRGLE